MSSISGHDQNIYNARSLLRERGNLNDQHVFVEALLKEEQPNSSESLTKPFFKENELNSNKFEELISDLSLVDLSRIKEPASTLNSN